MPNGHASRASPIRAAAASSCFGRSALRAALCARLDCANGQLSFRDTERGKPIARLRGGPAPESFSVSHSGRHGLLAFARGGRIGVDVEERVARRDLDALIAAVLTPDERAELASSGGGERNARFFTLWTIKEALLKALGTGLQLDVAGFEVPPAMRRGVTTGEFRFPHLPAVAWRVENLGNEHFAAALAHERPSEPGAHPGGGWRRSRTERPCPGGPRAVGMPPPRTVSGAASALRYPGVPDTRDDPGRATFETHRASAASRERSSVLSTLPLLFFGRVSMKR